mmetsp:Transcript_45280/g.70853  ORF Transcript_45280/g.70853 Transcript_45280/m.70853 type:complete len:256 (-) Transcript_45280:57-824(-)
MEYNCGGTVVRVDDVAEIAVAAGEAIMEIYKNEKDWDAKLKGDNTPLTAADLAANKIICDSLTAKYPDIPIISEENKMADYSTRKDYKYFFLVDPLDGTKEFIKRNGQFTVNIGLCDGNKPVLGVVRCPALPIAETYSGVVGQGANMEDDADRYPMSIRAKEFSEDDTGLKVVASLSHSNPETEAFIAKVGQCRSFRRCCPLPVASCCPLLPCIHLARHSAVLARYESAHCVSCPPPLSTQNSCSYSEHWMNFLQ